MDFDFEMRQYYLPPPTWPAEAGQSRGLHLLLKMASEVCTSKQLRLLGDSVGARCLELFGLNLSSFSSSTVHSL